MTRTTPNRFRVTVADIFWFEADTFGEAMAEARRGPQPHLDSRPIQ